MFTHYALHKLLLTELDEQGLQEPTPVQEAVIPQALEGADLRVTAETGSGKTLAYLLPLFNQLLSRPNPGDGVRALILVPTHELARQVLAVSKSLIRKTRLNLGILTGGAHFGGQMERLEEGVDVLIATPGRLLNHLKLGQPDLSDLEILVLDEADRMLDMGFSDDVTAIVEQCSPRRQTLLFSATLGSKGLRGMAAAVLREPQSINLSSGREQNLNIRHQVIAADDQAHKEALLLWLVQNSTYDKAVVFTNSRAQAERISGYLIHHQQRAGILHGEIDKVKRPRVLKLMNEGAFNILIATDVAARGLDIEGVDLVINFDVARRGDLYLHRSGRTGRAGNEGLSISLVSPQEWNLMASVARYLKLDVEQRTIEGLKGNYTGPKKVRSSGKAAGSKKKKKKKTDGAKAKKPVRKKP